MRSSAALDRCLAAVVRRLPPEGFPEAVQALRGGGAPRTAPPGRASLSVLSHWPRALEGVASIDAELGEALADLSSALAWRQNPNYLRRPPGPGFLDGYGYAVIAGPGGLIQAGIALGILLLAPGILYPAHAHPAEEVYLVLDAQSRWWREGEPWRERIGGAAIHHPPHLPHAMQAGPSMPLCAIYLWRGDLATNAALMGAPHLTET